MRCSFVGRTPERCERVGAVDVLVNDAAVLLFENEGVLSPANGYVTPSRRTCAASLKYAPCSSRHGAATLRGRIVDALLQTRPDRALRAFEASMRRLGLRQETRKRLAPAAGLEELPSAIGIPDPKSGRSSRALRTSEHNLQNDVDFQQARSSSQ
jgi:hypothetical protein